MKQAVRALDRLQRRHAALAIPFAVVKKFGDDGAGNKAALIAYFGFFSLFPLLLLFVTILGFVLEGNPSAQREVLDSALDQFPIIGGSLQTRSLSGSGVGLAIGAVGALLSGLGITMAAQEAFNTVYAVPRKRQPNFLIARVRGLALLAVFGALQIVSTVASGLVTGGLGGWALTIAGIAVSLALNLVLFFAVFRLLTDTTVATRELWPGIAIATVLWAVLQAVGGIYIAHVVKGADQTYGTFATVIGLLVWLYLGARVVVYSAEINTVLTRGLWPRAILPPLTAADRRARTALAKIEERDGSQRIAVAFDDGGRTIDSEPVLETAIAEGGTIMIHVANVADWRGKTLFDAEGQKVGKLEDVYVDTETDEPMFGSVKEGMVAKHLTFVPLQEAAASPDSIQIVAVRGEIKDAPNIEQGGELASEQERELYEHYGLAYAPAPTDSGRRLARR